MKPYSALAQSFMKRLSYFSFIATILLIFTQLQTFTNIGSAELPNQTSANVREDAYRANNIGVALLEQYKYKEAADAFRRALQLDPKLSLARINLGIALFNLPDLGAAQRELQGAQTLAPDAPQPIYVLALIARAQNRPEDAIAAFQSVLKIDAGDVATNVNLGQLYAQQRKYAEAIAVLRTALLAEPYNATALYNLGTALLRSGQREEGQSIIKRFQELRQRGSATTLGTNYLEQGRYAEAISSTGAEPELVDRTTPRVSFTDSTAEVFPGATKKLTSVPSGPLFGRQFKNAELTDTERVELALALGGNATFFDFDSDGDLDLFWATQSENYLFRNDGGKFTDVTGQSGALGDKSTGIATGAVAGDYDNDSRPDLFVIRNGQLSLYHNDGGKFSDVTALAELPAYPYLPSSVAFVDVDHDGDLDIFVAGLASLSNAKKAVTPAVFPADFAGAPNLLLRNNGNGKFTDVTVAAKLDRTAHSVAIVPTDFNNRRDIDLMVLNHGQAPELFSNVRDGSFSNVAKESGLASEGHWTCAAAGDINKDGYTDFFFGRSDGPGTFAISDGHEKFKSEAAPTGSKGARAAIFLDYDNDGLLDCVALSTAGLQVWRNISRGWLDVSKEAVSSQLGVDAKGGARLFAAGDIDSDGDEDLVFLSTNGDLRIARNEGGSANPSLKVNLAGRVSNRSGVGAKIELRAGSLAQKLETYSASPAPAASDIIFGLGKRTEADAVRVLWPAGILQAETDILKARAVTTSGTAKPATGFLTVSVTELDRKPSSCPYLYVWNGERFEFVTDFLGGGEMGHLEAPGKFNLPDSDEYVRIPPELLKERNGRYELRVTNELEEALFVDQLQLLSVAHPRDVEIYPNEGLLGPTAKPFKLYSTQAAQPPVSAIDENGRDVLSRITSQDREYVDDFRVHSIRGYADEHWLTLQLPVAEIKAQRVVLLLTGWTDYAWSSDNLAAAQSRKSLKAPALQTKDAQGRWQTVVENIGIPVGRPQTVVVDLNPKFLKFSREVRIVTNMRIYWDQILVDTSLGNFPTHITRLDPIAANLRWRGFSQEYSADGRQPLGYNYDQVSFTSPWKVMIGRYTREGDVRPLLRQSDDMFVVSRPGDEISLSFAVNAQVTLPRGWIQTFLLYAVGFSKEMDINSASPDQVGPLPFRAMSRYPYARPERYPLNKQRRRYLEEYNTRVVTSSVPLIDIELAHK